MEWVDERNRPARSSTSSRRRERMSTCPAAGLLRFYSVSKGETKLSSIWIRPSRNTQAVFSIFVVFPGLKNFEQTRDGPPSRREWDSARRWTCVRLEPASYHQSGFQDSTLPNDLSTFFHPTALQ